MICCQVVNLCLPLDRHAATEGGLKSDAASEPFGVTSAPADLVSRRVCPHRRAESRSVTIPKENTGGMHMYIHAYFLFIYSFFYANSSAKSAPNFCFFKKEKKRTCKMGSNESCLSLKENREDALIERSKLCAENNNNNNNNGVK